ncbi:MAG: ribose-phosphate diphosphokinase [Chromatiales bacterium]|nr:ribose-phosphate diphosphokinase [Chromatiales bacterium]
MNKAKKDNAIILAFPDYREPARRLAETAGLNFAEIRVHPFPDGETLVRLPETLPDEVILYTSLDNPNARLIELVLAAGTAPALGASRLALIAPYLCYMRQDSAFHPGEAISQRVIGALLARHFDTVITVDPHLHRTANLAEAVPTRRAVAVTAAPNLAQWLIDRNDKPLLIGPDEESEQWVRAIAEKAGLDYGVATKRRLGDRHVRVELPPLRYAGRRVVLVDDVVSTGRTLAEAARHLVLGGAASISVLVTHALFVDDAMDQLRAAGVGEICSTDSVLHSSNKVFLHELLAEALVAGGGS